MLANPEPTFQHRSDRPSAAKEPSQALWGDAFKLQLSPADALVKGLIADINSDKQALPELPAERELDLLLALAFGATSTDGRSSEIACAGSCAVGDKGGPHAITVTTGTFLYLTVQLIHDLVTDKKYASIGGSSRGGGGSFATGFVFPKPGQTAEAVITGVGFSFGVAATGIGPMTSVTYNESGLITTTGFAVGIGGPEGSVSHTWDIQSVTRGVESAVEWLAEPLPQEYRLYGR